MKLVFEQMNRRKTVKEKKGNSKA